MLLDAFARIAPDYPELALKKARSASPGWIARVDRLVQRHHLAARVEAVGEVDEEGREELLGRALFVCMPSRYKGWGMVAVEAAAGKAVLGTRIRGLKDAVRHGETGLLVEAGREEALAQGMRFLLDDDKERWRLGVQARPWAPFRLRPDRPGAGRGVPAGGAGQPAAGKSWAEISPDSFDGWNSLNQRVIYW